MYAHTPSRCLVVLPRGALFTLFTLLARLAPTTAHGSAHLRLRVGAAGLPLNASRLRAAELLDEQRPLQLSADGALALRVGDALLLQIYQT